MHCIKVDNACVSHGTVYHCRQWPGVHVDTVARLAIT